MKTKQYIFYADPGHGWARVSIKELIRLGITDKISGFSYMRGDWAYLEEDCDYSVFVAAKLKIDQVKPVFIDRYTNNESRIRNYNSFNVTG